MAAVRSGMTELIRRLRLKISDPAGAAQVWAAEELQDFLDQTRVEVRYAPLRAEGDYAPGGGIITYFDYYADVEDWESTVKLFDAAFNEITSDLVPADPESNEPGGNRADLGKWTFQASHYPPVFIRGYYYDLYGAAADVLEAWAAQEKLSFNFATDGQSFQRSQKVDMLLQLAATNRRRARVMSGQSLSLEWCSHAQ